MADFRVEKLIVGIRDENYPSYAAEISGLSMFYDRPEVNGTGVLLSGEPAGGVESLNSLLGALNLTGAGTVTITDNGSDTITISGAASASSDTMTNLGAGSGWYYQKVGGEFQLKSVSAGLGLSITGDTTQLEIFAPSGDEWSQAYNWGDHSAGGYPQSSQVVFTTGDQTISGEKTFATGVIIERPGTASALDTYLQLERSNGFSDTSEGHRINFVADGAIVSQIRTEAENSQDAGIGFLTSDGLGGIEKKMYISQANGVGIGDFDSSATPSRGWLEVAASSDTQDLAHFHFDYTANNTDAIVSIKNAAHSGSSANCVLKAMQQQNNRNGGRLIFGRENDLDWVTTSNVNTYIAFETVSANSLAEAMRINSSGYVGIATASPLYPLDVNGQIKATSMICPNLYADYIFDTSSSWSIYINGGYMYDNGSAISIHWQNRELYKSDGSTVILSYDPDFTVDNGNFAFDPTRQASYTFDLASGRFHMNTNGYIGINTASPLWPLDVSGSVRVIDDDSSYTDIRVGNTSTGPARVLLDASNGDFVGTDYMVIGQLNNLTAEISTSAGAGKLTLWAGSVTNTNQLVLETNGYVGISNTDSSYPIDVSGTGAFDYLYLKTNEDLGKIVFDYVDEPDISSTTDSTTTTGGSIAAATYYISITYADADGNETEQSLNVGPVTTTSGTSTITLDSIPTSDHPNVTRRNIYVGTSSSYQSYRTGILDNSTTSATLYSLPSTTGNNILRSKDGSPTAAFGNTMGGKIYNNEDLNIWTIGKEGQLWFEQDQSSIIFRKKNNAWNSYPIMIFNSDESYADDYEFGGMRYDSNVFKMGHFGRGTFTARAVKVVSNAVGTEFGLQLYRGSSDGWVYIDDGGTSLGGVNFMKLDPTQWTATSNTNRLLVFENTINMGGSAGWEGLYFNITENTYGSGPRNFINMVNNGTGMFAVDAEGNLTASNVVYNTGDQTISGVKDFASRPTVNDTGVLLSGEAAEVSHSHSDTRKINFVIDGGGSAIATGSKGYIEVPAGTIAGWDILADQTGSIVVDVKSGTYSSYPTTASIAGSEKPTLSSAIKNQDTSLTGWNSGMANGQVLEFDVESASTVERVTVVLDYQITI